MKYFVFLAINIISFNVACFIFAIRYWLLSHLLRHMFENGLNRTQSFSKYNYVTWLGLAFYIVVITVFIICAYNSYAPYFAQGLMLPVLYLASTLILVDSLLRMKSLTR